MQIPEENQPTSTPAAGATADDQPLRITFSEPTEPASQQAPGTVLPLRPAPRSKGGRPRSSSTSKRRNPPRRTERPVITPRLSMYCTPGADDEIDFSRTNDETVQRLARAVQKPEAQKRLGLVDATGAAVPPRTWQGMTSTLLDAVNAIGVQFAVNQWKLTDKQAELLLLRRDPATHQMVAQLSGELLDKYLPGGFGAYDKEITLVVVLGGFVLNAVQQIQAMRAADALANIPAAMAA